MNAKKTVHVIPVGDEREPHHASGQCWCKPQPKPEDGIMVHNAKDCRERFERQGLENPAKPWVLVIEDAPADPEVEAAVASIEWTKRHDGTGNVMFMGETYFRGQSIRCVKHVLAFELSVRSSSKMLDAYCESIRSDIREQLRAELIRRKQAGGS